MCFTYMILLLSTDEVGIIIFILQMSKRKLNEVAEGPIGREWLGWDFCSGSDAQSPRFSLDIAIHQSVVNDPPLGSSLKRMPPDSTPDLLTQNPRKMQMEN